MTADLTAALRQTSLFRSVPTDGLRAVAAASRVRTFRRGQVVFTRRDPGDALIVVLSGHVKVVTRSAGGGELTLSRPVVRWAGSASPTVGRGRPTPRPWRSAGSC